MVNLPVFGSTDVGF